MIQLHAMDDRSIIKTVEVTDLSDAFVELMEFLMAHSKDIYCPPSDLERDLAKVLYKDAERGKAKPPIDRDGVTSWYSPGFSIVHQEVS